jgi:predicted dehydrogenase
MGVAIWGAGWVAGAHARAYRAAGARLVAVGSRREESARALIAQQGLDQAGAVRVYTAYERLLADPEVQALSLCTPNGQHAREAVAAAQAGKHVLVEKPVATTPEDFDAVLQAVERAGVTAAACFIQRWNPLVNALRTMREQGDFGRIILAQADYWFGRQRPEWMRHAASAGSSFLVGAIHAVDSLRYILGEDVIEVQARAAETGNYYFYPPTVQALVRYGRRATTLADAAGVSSRAAPAIPAASAAPAAAGGGDLGAVGTISSSLVGHTGYVLNLELVGTEGSARNDQVYLQRIPNLAGWVTLPIPGPATGDVSQLPFPQLIDDFLRAIRERITPRASLPSTRNTHEVCFAVDRSLATGGAVMLPLT